MNDVLKQRLVGALVIIALAVVLWPLVFVEPSGEQVDRTSQVPRMPQIEAVELAEPQPIDGLAPAVVEQEEVALHEAPPGAVDNFEPVSSAPAEPESTAVDEPVADAMVMDEPPVTEVQPGEVVTVQAVEPPGAAEAVPALDERGIPIAWTLQVASVRDLQRAEGLVQELVDMGYKAYFKPVNRGSGRLYKVSIGPVFEKSQVAELKPVIDDRLKVQSIVSRYVP